MTSKHPANQSLPQRCHQVLVISPQPFYEDRGTPIALCHLVRALSELGYHIDFLTFPVGQPVSFPHLRLLRISNPLHIKSVPVGLSLRKLLLDIQLLFSTRKRLRNNRYCAVHAVEEASFIAGLLCGDIPIVYDMASSLPEHLAENRIFRPRAISKVFDAVEKWVVNRVNYVICSAGLIDHVRTLKPDASVSEWWFPAVASPATREETDQLRQSLGIAPADKMFLYAGTFARYQGVELVLEAIKIVLPHNQHAHFVLIGATEKDLRIFSRLLDSRIEPKVKIIRREPRERMSAYLAAAEFLISPRLYGRNVPLKVFDYLAAGKPILASDTPAHRAVLDESQTVFFQNSSQHLAELIQKLLDDPDKVSALATSAQEYARQHLSWAKFRDMIEEIYGRFCNYSGRHTTDIH